MSHSSPPVRHDLIKKLQVLKDTNSDLAGLLLEQVTLCNFSLTETLPVQTFQSKRITRGKKKKKVWNFAF